MSMNEKKYRNKIIYLSFFLAIVVMVRHTVNIDVYGLESGPLYFIELFVRSFSEIAVPTFFAISGYLFFVNFEYKKLLPKWKSRFFSIAIPYLIWNIVAYFYYQLIELLPFVRNNMNQNPEEFSFRMILLNALFGYHNITWFLRYLIMYIIVTSIFFFVLKHKLSIFIFPIAYVLGLYNQYCYWWIYYLLGAYAGIHFSKAIKEKVFSKQYRVLAAIVLLICSLINMRYPVNAPNRLLVIISVGSLWVMLDFLRVEKEPFWWEKLSFFIYCTHSMVLESIEKVILILLGNNMVGAVIDFTFAPVITFLLILLGACILKRIPKLWKVINGNRIS